MAKVLRYCVSDLNLKLYFTFAPLRPLPVPPPPPVLKVTLLDIFPARRLETSDSDAAGHAKQGPTESPRIPA
jgi:hypothetical protein